MNPVPVVWRSFSDNSPARGYWDQALLESLFAREWHVPGGFDFEHHTSFDDINPRDGIVLVTPGHGGIPAIRRINDVLNNPDNADGRPRPWALVIVTSDEEGVFPYWQIQHGNTAIWRQYVDPSQPHRPDRAIPCGYTTGTREQYANTEPPTRNHRMVFRGQVTDRPEHMRRRQFMAAFDVNRVSSDRVNATGGFAQGITQPEYRAEMASARLVACPTGNHSPDTFRMYEALESGATPIIDIRTTKNATGYWSLVFPHGHPFTVVDEWTVDTLADAVHTSPSPAESTAWWIGWKRDHATDLVNTIRTLADADTRTRGRFHPERDPVDDITVIIPTSPIAMHPDTSIIHDTIQSIRAQLPDAEIIIGMDPPRPELVDKYGDTWRQYVDRVVWYSNHHAEWRNTLPVIAPEWEHQANITRRMLTHVRTPLVLFVEHDTPIMGNIEWHRMAEIVLAGDVDHMRLHYDTTIHPDHQHMMRGDRVTDDTGFTYQRTIQWSQRPHMARTDWYRDVIDAEFPIESRTMIEDWMHGVCEVADSPDVWRLAIYTPTDSIMGIQRSGHSDGRAGHDPKFEMVFAR